MRRVATVSPKTVGRRRNKGKAVSSPASSAGSGPKRKQRPLSPHLSVYRYIPNMVASIMHRMTGVALYFGTLLVAWWLIAAATGPAAFAWADGFLTSWFGILILFGYTWALMHHLLGGLRHFAWDTGRLLGKEMSTRLAYATFAGSVSLTVLLWLVAAIVR